MNLRTAKIILDQIEASQCSDLKHDLYRAALRYTSLRFEWRLSTTEERQQMDSTRTRAHEALIDAFDILSREQAKRGEDHSWRKALGDNRKELGDWRHGRIYRSFPRPVGTLSF